MDTNYQEFIRSQQQSNFRERISNGTPGMIALGGMRFALTALAATASATVGAVVFISEHIEMVALTAAAVASLMVINYSMSNSDNPSANLSVKSPMQNEKVVAQSAQVVTPESGYWVLSSTSNR